MTNNNPEVASMIDDVIHNKSQKLRGRLLTLKGNINRINFVVAIAFIVILSASSVLTGSAR
jgi:hypothetical protein